jgi:hypothetical protein
MLAARKSRFALTPEEQLPCRKIHHRDKMIRLVEEVVKPANSVSYGSSAATPKGPKQIS